MARYFFLAFVTIFSVSFPFLTNAQQIGFSVELLHRDSPKSPFYNPSKSIAQHLISAIARSIPRATHFNEPMGGKVISANGEYLIDISLGTPPVRTFVIADTGSDLIWTQCKPCSDCFKQLDPIFDPNASSTYKDLACKSEQCTTLVHGSSCTKNGKCWYDVRYGDRSYTTGNLAVETLTLGSNSFPNIVFGCGHSNQGTFNEKDTGIVGLGGGPLSLISQLGTSAAGKFSYCLVPLYSDSTSSIHFGSNAIVSGSGVVSTPIANSTRATFYFLTLEGVSVNGNFMEFRYSMSSGLTDGNIIIDSGTTLTLFPPEFYSQLEKSVSAEISAARVTDPTQQLSLCYHVGDKVKYPEIIMHFKGANVTLQSLNTFVQISEDVECFAFGSIENGAIYGNLGQINFLVGYDIVKREVSFKAADCGKM